jgi:hypothetical protein
MPVVEPEEYPSRELALPPHPETYTFSHLSTRNAVGDMFGNSEPEPKVVEYI